MSMRGRGYLFFIVTALSGRYSTHNLKLLFFFFTKRAGHPQGEAFGRIKPLASRSSGKTSGYSQTIGMSSNLMSVVA
jgi:hypothetical protein